MADEQAERDRDEQRDAGDEERAATRAAGSPNRYGWIDADQTVPVKKSIGSTSRKNSNVWTARTRTIPTVVTTPRAAAEEEQRPR